MKRLIAYVQLCLHFGAIMLLCLAGELSLERVREAFRQLRREASRDEKAPIKAKSLLPPSPAVAAQTEEKKTAPPPAVVDDVSGTKPVSPTRVLTKNALDDVFNQAPNEVTEVVRSRLPKVDADRPLQVETTKPLTEQFGHEGPNLERAIALKLERQILLPKNPRKGIEDGTTFPFELPVSPKDRGFFLLLAHHLLEAMQEDEGVRKLWSPFHSIDGLKGLIAIVEAVPEPPPSAPEVDPNAQTASPKNPRVAAVSPAELQQLRQDIPPEPPKGPVFQDMAEPKGRLVQFADGAFDAIRDDVAVTRAVREPGKAERKLTEAEAERMRAQIAAEEAAIHVDPVPTAAKGVDKIAAAEAEIRAARQASATAPDPNRVIVSQGVPAAAWEIQAGCAHALFVAATGNEDSERYRASVDPIPDFGGDWNDRFDIVFLTDPRFDVLNMLHYAGVGHAASREEVEAASPNVGPRWRFGQSGARYLNKPFEDVVGLVGKDEKPLTVLEVAEMLVQYPSAIPMEQGSGIDCVGADGKLFTIARLGDGSLTLRETEPYEYGQRIGVATRGSDTGEFEMNVN